MKVPKPRTITHCPTTGFAVQRKNPDIKIIPGGQAIWWHCSACDGWHVRIREVNTGQIIDDNYCYL